MIQINWGLKIAILYIGFVVLIAVLVIKSTQQHFDLVSKDYYSDEIAFQKTIDAGKNQASLSHPIALSASPEVVTISFPKEFEKKVIMGSVQFYSQVNSEWDKTIPINLTENSITFSRNQLKKANYLVKINCTVDGKNYYQESALTLQ